MTTITRTTITPTGSVTTRELVRASDITGVSGVKQNWGHPLGYPSRIFRVWMNRIVNADIIDRGLIRQWTTGVLPRAHGYEFGGARMNLTVDEAGALVRAFDSEVYHNRDGYRLTDVHEQFGREWLASNWAKLWKEFNPPDDLIHPDQILAADTFRFVDTREVMYGTHYRPPSFVPVYAARYHGLDGEIRTFTYYWSAWQSGGGR